MYDSSIPDRSSAFPYAGVMTRLAAYAVDCTLLFGGLLVWQGALYQVNPLLSMMRNGQQPTGRQIHTWVFATATLPFLLYFAVAQSSAHQATPGQRWLKLKVVAKDGTRVSLRQAVLRGAVMLIPFELNHAVLFHVMPRDGQLTPAFSFSYMGVLTIMAAYVAAVRLTRHRQSVHDLIAGTVVQRTLE